MYKPHTFCRACDYGKPGAPGIKSAAPEKLIEVLDLGVQSLANDFCAPGTEQAGYAPLKLMLCPKCGLGQLSVVVNPSILYRHYSYVTSPSDMMHDHFVQLMKDIAWESDGNTVLEIGSNDGKLLAMMQEASYSTMGVDPAENLASLARSKGVPVTVGFFGSDLAKNLPVSDIVIARHVFCHVDDWHDFVKGLEAVSHKETLICIEAPYAENTIKKCEFDQVYHEHLSFLTIKSVMALLENTNLRLHRIMRYAIHGGAVLLMLRRKDSSKTTIEAFSENITVEDWKAFSVEARNQIDRLRSTVRTLVAQGKRVAGLGASAKSTVWINACGFTRKDIAFITDDTPQKQYTCSPGTDIPIVDPGAILRELPDYTVMWCWNFESECLKKNEIYLSKGGKFIIPVPTIRIVP